MTNRVTYEGFRQNGCCHVDRICGSTRRRLPLRLTHVNHSPTGFEWGYSGSGPAQTAYALCYDALLAQGMGVDEARSRALRIHQPFNFRVVAGLERNPQGTAPVWYLSAAEVFAAILELEEAQREQEVAYEQRQ